MAFTKESKTARPKRADDGAVNARYKKVRPKEDVKSTAARKTAAKAAKGADEEKKLTARRKMVYTAEPKGTKREKKETCLKGNWQNIYISPTRP